MTLKRDQLEAIHYACYTALYCISILPQSDIVAQLSQILATQQDILENLLESRHYGSDNLDTFIDCLDTIIEQVDLLIKQSEM